MPDMYGAPTGLITAAQERRAQQLHDLSMQKGDMELTVAKMELSRQQEMMKQMGQLSQKKRSSTGQIDDLASDMDVLADIAMKAGMPEKAKDYAIAGSTLRKNQRELIETKLDTDIKEMNMMSALLQGVNDDQSWREANAMFTMQTGKESPWAKLPYHPQVIAKLQQGIQTAKDRAAISASKAREAAARAQTDETRTRVDLVKAQTRLADARTKLLKKTGTQEPKAADLRAITDLIQHDYGGAVTSEDARVMARPVAERMVQLMSSQNLTKSEAAERAYQEAKSDGVFGGVVPRRQLSGSRARPLDIPKSKEKLKPNMYYKGTGQYEGQTLLWTGTGFIQPPEEEEFEEFPEDEED